MEFLGEQELFRQVVDGTVPVVPEIPSSRSFAVILDALAVALAEEVAVYTGGAHAAKLARTHIAFLPMRSLDGYCTDRDERGLSLGGYLIGLHDGLYFSTRLLAKAFVLESLEDDLAHYRPMSLAAYNAAVAFFIWPEVQLIGKMDFDDFEPELQGVFSAVQTNAAMVMVQFVTLHEFAHAVADDQMLMDLYRAHAVVSSAAMPAETSAYWSAEFLADELALRWLCSADRPPETLWTNVIAVYLLFEWLADIEIANGKPLCPLHSPPRARAERILELAVKLLPSGERASLSVAWARASARKWHQGRGDDPAVPESRAQA